MMVYLAGVASGLLSAFVAILAAGAWLTARHRRAGGATPITTTKVQARDRALAVLGNGAGARRVVSSDQKGA